MSGNRSKCGASREPGRRLLVQLSRSRQAPPGADSDARSSAIPFLTGITVVPITTTIRSIPSEVVLTEAEDGMFTDCAVNTDNIQTIQKAHLDAFITHLSQARMREVRAAIEFALGFDALL